MREELYSKMLTHKETVDQIVQESRTKIKKANLVNQ